MRKERLVFMGTPDIAKIYLQALIDNQYDIIATYTQPPRKQGRGMKIQDSAIHTLSQQYNIPVYHPKNFSSLKVKKEFKELRSDIVVIMGYGVLLPQDILNIPVHGCINIHISLLPRWRGAAPIEYAILNGDEITGACIFKLEEKLDSGPIIATQEINIENHISGIPI